MMDIIKAVIYSSLAPSIVIMTLLIFGLNIYSLLSVVLIVFSISFISSILIGIPTHLVLKKLNIRNGFAYIFIGFISPALLLFISTFPEVRSPQLLLSMSLILGCVGAFCAYVFWLCVMPSEYILE
ncbi:hypothetical protein I6E84_02695 [Psychrobacter sp. SCQQ22]|uniref:hypothetical protein n=1 Tax=Psychrobacter sp. SCQQ22 TaxID=2792059 RepID=UPI0018CD8435|nr:hypothetical protein [Psychrobacter sp. SCQQ22]MBH0085125.1 hypothetical protein [Psychrobacter sp. SCQQ22]